MGMLAHIYDSSLGNCSNDGVSARYTEVCIVNVDGPFKPSEETPGVRLIKRNTGNVVCVPIDLDDRWTMFGGAFVYTSDSRFAQAVEKLSGYNHSFPVALHDRVE
ncbi:MULTISPECIES: hypothetical protein [unclassified Bradyrhizobium]|uniref:hypothetical protein n=1 Tax=unclassified Bradyrhizobium TaxID=2631580 RepID=UPI00138F54A2|nr:MULTISPECIES: hypothetical protein [unclassified Bradyrhizobium]